MGKEVLQQNMKALSAYYPEYVQWLKKEKDVDWFNLIGSKNGDYNAAVNTTGGTFPIYNMDNPRKFVREVAKKSRLFNEEITIIVGMGLGHLLKALLTKAEKKHIIIVVEPIAHILKEAFSLYDFSEAIINRQVAFAVTIDDFNMLAGMITNEIVIQGWHMIHEEYTLKRELEYRVLTEQIINCVNNIQCNHGTIEGAGAEIALNDIKNLPYVIRHKGVATLKDKYKGMPGIVVSTGPSLQKNIHHLKEAQGKVVIVSTMQALRILLAYDIRPDFVCTVDYGKTNMGHFRGLMDSGVPLVALNRTYAPILQEWAGPKYIIGTPLPGYETTGLAVISKKGSIDQGGSVSHSCLGTLIQMGCNPIALIGQDLALGKTSHFKQADESGDIFIDDKGMIQWKVTDPNSHLFGKTYTMGPATATPGYFGGTVLTNLGLKSFITNFEHIFRFRPDVKFINCTEGGAKIKYSREMTLAKFIEKHCKKEIMKEQEASSLEEEYMDLIKETIPKLEEEVTVFTSLIENGKKALKEDDNMEEYAEKNERDLLKKAMEDNATYSKEAEELAKKNPLLQMYIYKESVKIQGRELKVRSDVRHLLRNEEDLSTRIKRNRLIIEAAITASKELKKAYEKTISLLKEYVKTEDEALLSTAVGYTPSLENVETFFKEGNFSRPLLEARRILSTGKKGLSYILPGNIVKKAEEVEKKALAMRDKVIQEAKEDEAKERRQDLIEYCFCLEHGQKAGREEKDFNKSAKLLRKAVKLFPDRWEARWGLASAYAMMEDDKEAYKQFQKLVEHNPKNFQFKFEMGLVLLRLDPKEGFDVIKGVMEETEQYDSFLLQFGLLYMEHKMFPEAKVALEEYSKKFPADVRGHNALLSVYKKLGMRDKEKITSRKIQQLVIN